MKTMIAKYPGTCFECGEKFPAGTLIKYYGRHHCEHAECAEENPVGEDEAAGLEHGTLANDRRLARRGLTVVRFSSGETMTQNSRGRCEDAPCCGCCT